MTSSTDRPIRVAVFATGAIGTLAIQSITRRPDMELVGVWVHSEDKADRDVGEVTGGREIGITTTRSIEEILASRPQVAVYTATGPEQDAFNMPIYLRLLGAGVDVITVSSAWLMYPAAGDPVLTAQLSAAAQSGGSTLYCSGLEPGFMGDHLVALLSTLSDTVESVRTQEFFYYHTYENHFLMFDVFGFGRPMDETPLMQLDGMQAMTWGPAVHFAAAALGMKIDRIRETYQRRESPRDLHVASGLILAGTCGALRMETIGVVNGRDTIVIEHINRMAPDLAPDWPTAIRDGTYRVVVDGQPRINCELTLGEAENAGDHGMIATTMRLVNAIPYVTAHTAGLVSALDLPLTTPAGR